MAGGPSQFHMTAVAGIAIGDNDETGIVEVAPHATYAAFNFLEGPQYFPRTFSAANIAAIEVFNTSWGSGNVRRLRGGAFLELQAVKNATTNAFCKRPWRETNKPGTAAFKSADKVTQKRRQHSRESETMGKHPQKKALKTP